MLTILDLLSSKEKEKLIIKHIKTNEVIFHEGENANYLGFVVSGTISIETYSLTGSLITFNTILPGMMFGNNLVFSSNQTYLGDVKAKVKTTLYLLSKDNLIEILQSNKAFLKEFLKAESEFTKTLNAKVKILSLNSAQERLLYYLHYKGNKARMISVTSLGRELGLTREATSRTITKLIKENKIKREGNTLSLI